MMLNTFLINQCIIALICLLKYFVLPGEMLIEVMEVAGIAVLKQILGICVHFGLNED